MVKFESKTCSGVGSHDKCDIGLPLKLGSSVNDSFILIHQMLVLLQFVDQFKININRGSTDSASIQKVQSVRNWYITCTCKGVCFH